MISDTVLVKIIPLKDLKHAQALRKRSSCATGFKRLCAPLGGRFTVFRALTARGRGFGREKKASER